jgi:exopolysaccharide production protein ExoF
VNIAKRGSSTVSSLCLLILINVLQPLPVLAGTENEITSERPPENATAGQKPTPAPRPAAQIEPAGKTEGAETTEARLLQMSAVERLRLRVPDSPELSGEYSVDTDGTISMPGVGRLSVASLTTEALERELSRSISMFLRRDLTASIEILRFQPYFIVGMVAEPGANEWRPGLNVVKAIALARGTVRHPAASDDPVSAQTTQQAQTQLQFSLALLARLKAERDGGSTVAPQDRTSSIVAGMPPAIQPRLNEFLARQSAILDEQRSLLQNQLAGFERDREAAKNEVEAAERQEKAIKEQLDISTTLLNDVEHLKEQRLVSNSRYLTQRSDLMTSQIRYAEAQSLTERARTRLEAASRQIETLQRERNAALNQRIETLQREIAQLEVNLLPRNSGAGLIGPQVASNLVYHIARETEAGIKTLEATIFTDVYPGDVTVVSEAAPSAPGTLSAGGAEPAEKLQRAIETSSAAQGAGAGRGSGRSR